MYILYHNIFRKNGEKRKVVKPSLIRCCLITYYSYYPTDAVVNVLPRGNEISTPLLKTVTNSHNRAVGILI